jgi:prevent-host-death family protein
MKSLTASQLRGNIYRLLDQVIETGEPLEIQRRKKKVRIVPAEPVRRIDRLKKRNWIIGNPEAIVTVDWSREWNRDLP